MLPVTSALLLLILCESPTAHSRRVKRAIGGVALQPGEMPWLASIRFQFWYGPYRQCTASLIHERFLLTAAHCVYDHDHLLTAVANPYGKWVARIGSVFAADPGQLEFETNYLEPAPLVNDDHRNRIRHVAATVRNRVRPLRSLPSQPSINRTDAKGKDHSSATTKTAITTAATIRNTPTSSSPDRTAGSASKLSLTTHSSTSEFTTSAPRTEIQSTTSQENQSTVTRLITIPHAPSYQRNVAASVTSGATGSNEFTTSINAGFSTAPLESTSVLIDKNARTAFATATSTAGPSAFNINSGAVSNTTVNQKTTVKSHVITTTPNSEISKKASSTQKVSRTTSRSAVNRKVTPTSGGYGNVRTSKPGSNVTVGSKFTTPRSVSTNKSTIAFDKSTQKAGIVSTTVVPTTAATSKKTITTDKMSPSKRRVRPSSAPATRSQATTKKLSVSNQQSRKKTNVSSTLKPQTSVKSSQRLTTAENQAKKSIVTSNSIPENWDWRRERYAVERSISRVIVHPKYSHPSYQHDLALLVLDRPVPRQRNNILKVMRVSASPFTDYKCVFAGWGCKAWHAPPEIHAQKVTFKVHSAEVCRNIIGHFTEETQICAGSLGNEAVSICDGDSGGPLVCWYHDQWKQIGVASYIAEENFSPGVFENISAYSSWIGETITRFERRLARERKRRMSRA